MDIMLEKINKTIPDFVEKLDMSCLSDVVIYTIYSAILACEKYDLREINIILKKFNLILEVKKVKRVRSKIKSLCRFIISKVIINMYNEVLEENPYNDMNIKELMEEIINLSQQMINFMEHLNLQDEELFDSLKIINTYIQPILFYASKELSLVET
jgi:molybdenum cofactor biosynthesis enzyme MoaA